MLDAADGKARDVPTAIAVLRQRFGDRLQTGEAIRRQHANTLTWLENQPPDAVIWVETAEEVREVVRVASDHRAPIIPFGAGTSLEGHVNAPFGGLSLDFSRMNQILAVNERDLDCVVQPGVSRKQLNDYLRDLGLFFPVDPGAEEATIGGMAATRASGTTALRYGTMRENVLNITAVMADGSIVKTAQRARKSSAGYDLTRLMVGSEGTLGLITELTVRLYGIPELILSAVCPFRTLEGACNTVISAMQLGLGVRPHGGDGRGRHLRRQQVRQAGPGGGADAVPGVPRHRRIGPQPGRAVPPDRGERGRHPLRLGREGGGPPPAVEGAPRVLLGREKHLARQGHVRHRHLRADLPARRMRGGDAGRHQVAGPDRADRRPRRRRQLPHPADDRPLQPEGGGRRWRPSWSA